MPATTLRVKYTCRGRGLSPKASVTVSVELLSWKAWNSRSCSALFCLYEFCALHAPCHPVAPGSGMLGSVLGRVCPALARLAPALRIQAGAVVKLLALLPAVAALSLRAARLPIDVACSGAGLACALRAGCRSRQSSGASCAFWLPLCRRNL